ncbi:hypothetical protein [Sinomicrobium sp. M5D2P17]
MLLRVKTGLLYLMYCIIQKQENRNNKKATNAYSLVAFGQEI